ncbi:hypothetical protein ACFE04_002365 [Oxalis oulophora]
MKGKIASSNASRLSLAGRHVLAQSSLISIPIYSMQTSIIPISTYNDMEKIVRRFLWSGSSEHFKLPLVAHFCDLDIGWKWKLFYMLLPESMLLCIAAAIQPSLELGPDLPVWGPSASAVGIYGDVEMKPFSRTITGQ